MHKTPRGRVPWYLQAELIEATECRQVRAGGEYLGHAEVFPMGA